MGQKRKIATQIAAPTEITQSQQGSASVGWAVPAKSLVISRNGISTGRDFARLMTAMMSDILSGAVSPPVGNAACNAGRALLKVVELQLKYGTSNLAATGNDIVLSKNEPAK